MRLKILPGDALKVKMLSEEYAEGLVPYSDEKWKVTQGFVKKYFYYSAVKL